MIEHETRSCVRLAGSSEEPFARTASSASGERPSRGQLALQHLAEDEADLLSYAAELRSERDTYRLMLTVALGQIRNLAKTCGRLREAVQRQNAVIKKYVGIRKDGRTA